MNFLSLRELYKDDPEKFKRESERFMSGLGLSNYAAVEVAKSRLPTSVFGWVRFFTNIFWEWLLAKCRIRSRSKM